MTVNELFEEARERIAVPDDVLKEARKRRDEIRRIVEGEFDTLRTFGSGSLAHGTQNDPLSDADAGMVLDRRVYEGLGPQRGWALRDGGRDPECAPNPAERGLSERTLLHRRAQGHQGQLHGAHPARRR